MASRSIARRAELVRGNLRHSGAGRRLRQTLSRTSYRLHGGDRAQGEAARIVGELDRNGIAVTHVHALGIDEKKFLRLAEAGVALAGSDQARERGADPRDDANLKKPFFFRLLGFTTVHVDKPDPFNDFALDPILLSIANDHIGTYSWLMRYNVWLNLPSGEPARSSQLWHRDPPGNYLKTFVALEDITPDTGPFSYIPGSHARGPRAALAPPEIEEGVARRVLDDEMAAVVPRGEWVTATGPAGTIILADTTGFHKGGFVGADRRVLLKCMFGDWLCDIGSLVKFDQRDDIATSRAQRWATGW